MNDLLEVRALNKRYPVGPGRRALHAVEAASFTIRRGESLGLVGESGSGKSTLARILARLIDATDGSIVFAGEELTALPAARVARSPWRARIQMVLQDPGDSLNPRCTAFQAIAEPMLRLDTATAPSRRAAGSVAERVTELARQVGLPEALLGRFPHQLSGGQKARVGIARALAPGPELLILDEPTSALDVSVQATILHLLDRLRKELGISYLFVSHDLNVVRLMCERVLVMYLGRIAEIGPTDAVLDAPRHPYTQALVAAIPGRRRANMPHLELPGEPMSPIDPDPNTCRFHGRCPKAQALCVRSMPLLREHAPGHQAACHAT